jgi:transposase InsO family protein
VDTLRLDKDAEIAWLGREVAELRQEEILRKAAAYFAKEAAVSGPGGVPLRVFPLERQRAGPAGSRRQGRTRRADHQDPRHSGGAYGSPRVPVELHEQGMRVNRKRIMRRCDVVGRHLRRRKRTTIPDPAAAPVPDLIGRDFTATAPDQRWYGDITYLRVGGCRLDLATVIDIATRRLIGWSINTHMRAELVIDALDAADACQRHGIRRSMGRIGSSYDNALAESFFATLKRELDVDRRRWTSEADARRDVFR